MVSLAFILLMTWLLFFIVLDYGVQKGNSLKNSTPKRVSVDVIIAARNEEDNIQECLKSIISQSGGHSIRVILVDDHSEDDTVRQAEMARAALANNRLLIMSNDSRGKKAALKTAVKWVESDYVFFTDADCILDKSTISNSVSYLKEHELQAVLGLVSYSGKGLWHRMLQLEQANNMAVTESLTNTRIPAMANGANLLISSQVLELYEQSLNHDNASGDDVFFIQKLVEEKFSYGFCKDAIVTTKPPVNIRQLFSQRLRWAKKSSDYKHKVALLMPRIIWLFQLIYLFVLVNVMSVSFVMALVIVLTKMLIEFAFHHHWQKRYSQKPNVITEFLVSLIYPVYVLVIGFASLFRIKYQWKGREYE